MLYCLALMGSTSLAGCCHYPCCGDAAPAVSQHRGEEVSGPVGPALPWALPCSALGTDRGPVPGTALLTRSLNSSFWSCVDGSPRQMLCSCPRCLAQQGPVGDRHSAHETKNPEDSVTPGSCWAWELEPRLAPCTSHCKRFLQPFLLVLLNIAKQR